ncbi:amidohydrolase [Flavihumibacter solisilvae]|uniref:Amidohydrolase n=1 Tax=Flavihumibacter solisilvae TaxID=1349421 RepID=A0A0C1IUK0_9BACT|nr:amidohydrolase [Flavihumibacter solisilvae]KIC94164.1 amidohydrolase [Flavihumibacter solisilvae]
MRISFLMLAMSAILLSCSGKKPADLVVHNAHIYTVDENFSTAEALAVKDGRILASGTNKEILDGYEGAEVIDAGGKFLYPGFIDAHCHFYAYGLGLQTVNLVGTDSWSAILDSLKSFAVRYPEGWLVGRGWDQNDWQAKEFPTNDELNKLFPDRPVILSRIDGHAAIANNKALALAGVKAGDKMTGGEVEVKNGVATGLLIDNAVDRVAAVIPAPGADQVRSALLSAEANCFAVGLTTVDDCGLDYTNVEFIDSLQKKGDLQMRVYAMLSDAKRNYDYILPKGPIKTERLTVRGFKVYADGALGSRGACLLKPYSDKPGHYGFLLSDREHFDSVAALLAPTDFQMCTHAIGDSGNRTVLNIYAKYLKGKNDKRWRIEHAQVVDPADFSLFGNFNIVPSVQPTHATSDMYWAGERLGKEREKTAYAYNDLLKQNNWIALGTDFPVEDISPFKTFYAAVVRKDSKGYPAEGYQVENSLSRENTLKGMTIWAAQSNFEEKEKGSIEKGKLADFILLDQDLMKVAPDSILSTRVLRTVLGGKSVFVR